MTKAMEIPKDLKIERYVISCVLIDKRSHHDVFNLIKSINVFTDEKLKHLFRATKLMYQDNEPINVLTVSNKLRFLGLSASVTDVDVIELSQSAGSSADIEFNIRLLQQFWVRRRTIDLSNRLQLAAYDPEEDVFATLEKVELTIDDLNHELTSSVQEKAWSENLKEVRDKVRLITDKDPNEMTGCPTGFRDVDTYTNGWLPGDLIILAAGSGVGKTALALKSLYAVGESSGAVGMFSLEMSAYQLTSRITAIETNFHLKQLLRSGFEKEEYFDTLEAYHRDMSKHNILIDDRTDISLGELKSKARMWKRKHDIKFLVVDYIQLMGGNSNVNREREVASVSKGLKGLAKELQIPIMALSQLNRDYEKRPGRRPKKTDLRESSALEHDADVLLFIHRPEYYEDMHTDKLLVEKHQELTYEGANTELIFAKYRAGSIGSVPLKWLGDKTKFTDADGCSCDDIKPAHVADETPF